MPQRYRPGRRAAPPGNYTPTAACKAARRSSIAGLLGRSSQSTSAEKRRRQDTDDNEDDEDGDDGYDDESDASLPRKKPRSDQHDVREAVKVEDIQDLERIKVHLNDALLFINKLGIARQAPKSLRPLLMARPEATLSMAASIRKRMLDVSRRLGSQMYNCRKTGITSDDMSKAMADFLPEIEDLMMLPKPDALKRSYDLVIELSESSYGELDSPKASGYGDRPSDGPADLLLRKLIRKRLAAGETWDWKEDLEQLDKTSKHVGDYGIEPWYPRSREALRTDRKSVV